jgi:Holliday junction resolvase RusA-like endonuclease
LAKNAPPYPKCDVDNLAKGVLDALNGVAFADDSQIVELHVTKSYGDVGRTEVKLGNVS